MLTVLLLGACGGSPTPSRAESPETPGAALTPDVLREGDVVFQSSASTQANAVEAVTRSPWSHVGVLIEDDGRLRVLEAVQPVKLTAPKAWVARSVGGKWDAARLPAALWTADTRRALRAAGRAELGKDYDLLFEWSDDKMYCSELVHKVLKSALGLELGRLQTFGDFDLSDPAIAAAVRQRWGSDPPLTMTVISPQALYEDPRLVHLGQP